MRNEPFVHFLDIYEIVSLLVCVLFYESSVASLYTKTHEEKCNNKQP